MVSDQFKIEKGIALKGASGPRAAKYPLDAMEVGDSFLIPGGTAVKNPARSSIYYQQVRHQKKFVSRTVDGGVRVWRVA